MKNPPGGGGHSDLVPTGVCRWRPPNPYPSWRVILAEKGIPIIRDMAEKDTHYHCPLLGFFIQENDVFVYFSNEMGENI